MPRAARPARSKSIYDPVHGPMRLAGASLELIGHPAFQRLWGIRQTGCAHLVFPGANHTRLEHSLGVRHVAGRIATRLELDPEASELLQVGGLLHDLGHAPFSHTLDGTMQEAIGSHHEAISRALVLGEVVPAVPSYRAGAGSDSVRSLPEILERHHV
ncbi:MAG: HD domain-containing protein, partial [Thermoplasmata archaeon]|nr:HD domain-containing protein [Thermoplasmata archaeon]